MCAECGFQFHKVRLKEISKAQQPANSIFQFHKVRLKAGTDERSISTLLFQFHKVRLKVRGQSPNKLLPLFISIP